MNIFQTDGDVGGQKAPSAKRCIKTGLPHDFPCGLVVGQKAPSAKRCIKTKGIALARGDANIVSESTERQKVH